MTALLLRPRDKGTAQPLPRLAFPLVGGWLGWQFLTPWIAQRSLGCPALAAAPLDAPAVAGRRRRRRRRAGWLALVSR